MAVGKTTLGKKLAKELNIPFLDTDKLVEQEAACSIDDIFKRDGEEAFRRLEAGVLRSIRDKAPSVVATGGGLPCYYDNMAFMNEHGFTVYLEASTEFIYSRLVKAKHPRPLVKSLDNEELREFIAHALSQRQAWYRQSQLHISLPVKSAETLVNTVASGYLKHSRGS